MTLFARAAGVVATFSVALALTTRDFSFLSLDSLGEKNRPVSQVIALLNEMSTQLQTEARFSSLVKCLDTTWGM